MALAGSFRAVRKDGTVYYRSSITYKNKHISLGSFQTEKHASAAYRCAQHLLNSSVSPKDYSQTSQAEDLSFDKAVSLINFRDNGVYSKNPIYLCQKYFLYYLTPSLVFKFDIDDLFYYSSHRISRRDGHLFVADYGMQVNLLSRYGIRSHAVTGRDYRFINGDSYDFRYENIEIINRFYGVAKFQNGHQTKYKASILIHGTFIIGIYDTEVEAAIAYNKACDIITKKLPGKKYRQNYIDMLSPSQYAEIYTRLSISKKISEYVPK